MSGHLVEGAVVEPDSIRKMKNKVDELITDLAKSAKELISKTENLNQKGFQDGNFESLHRVITERKEDLEKLKNIMLSFSDYLQETEKNIRNLVEAKKISSNSNINII
jgi:hypothetical protein